MSLLRLHNEMICIVTGVSYGQDGRKTIIGSVAGDSGEPLPGASILIKGTSSGTTTDADESFRLKVHPSRTYLFFPFQDI